MLEPIIVIVVDNSNYKKQYAEKVPFKATVEEISDLEVTVISLTTGNEYELYRHQILEYLDIDDIAKMLDLSKYGY